MHIKKILSILNNAIKKIDYSNLKLKKMYDLNLLVIQKGYKLSNI